MYRVRISHHLAQLRQRPRREDLARHDVELRVAAPPLRIHVIILLSRSNSPRLVEMSRVHNLSRQSLTYILCLVVSARLDKAVAYYPVPYRTVVRTLLHQLDEIVPVRWRIVIQTYYNPAPVSLDRHLRLANPVIIPVPAAAQQQKTKQYGQCTMNDVRCFHKAATFFISFLIARFMKSLIVIPVDATKAAILECNSDGIRKLSLPLYGFTGSMPSSLQ